jgi:hypothetical protein
LTSWLAPQLARVLGERRRQEREQGEAAQRAECERAAGLATGITPALRAYREGRLDAVRWQTQQLRTAPAEDALREVMRRPSKRRCSEYRWNNLTTLFTP